MSTQNCLFFEDLIRGANFNLTFSGLGEERQTLCSPALQGATHEPRAGAGLHNTKRELQVKKGGESDSEMPPNPISVTTFALATYTRATPRVSQAVRETEAQRMQNFLHLATVEAKAALLSPSSPESLSPVATNGIKNTD